MTTRIRSIAGAVAIAVVLGGAVGAAGVAVFKAEQDYAAASRTYTDAQIMLSAVAAEDQRLNEQIASAEAELSVLEAILAEREAFSTQLDRVRRAAASAIGKVETAEWLNRVAALQDEVVMIDSDPVKVKELTAKVAAEAAGIETAIADHNAEVKRLAEAAAAERRRVEADSAPTTSGGDAGSPPGGLG